MANTTSRRSEGFLTRHVPIVGWLRDYRWGSWLTPDLIAGVSVAALLIPESMGMAGVAGLPAEVGLYAAPLALLGYAIFGRSTVLVVATSGSTAAISASVVAELNAGGNTDSAVSLSAALALFTGVAFLAVGLVRLGWVANFMSKTVIQRFVIGLSISIIIGQLDDLLGIEVSGDNSFEKLGSVLSQIGDWNQATVVVGAMSLALLFGMERYVNKLPAALTAVVHPNPLHQQEDARDEAPDPDRDAHRRRLSVPGEEQDGPQTNLDRPEDEPADRPTMPGSLFDFERPHQPETPGRNRRQGDAADEGLWTHDVVERTASEQH